MKRSIKKITALLLALTLFCALFTACGNDDFPRPPDDPQPQPTSDTTSDDPLRICVDLGGAGRYAGYNTAGLMENFIATVKDYGGPGGIEVEVVPSEEGAERESAIKHIKTELASGKGPDLFIVDSYDGNFFNTAPVFPIPQQLMDRRVFLPLDEYIENAQFMEWDKLTPQVMEAGRGEEGQLLVPLSYTFPVTCFRKEEAEHTPSRDYTWQDMVSDPSLVTTAAGCFQQLGGGIGYYSPLLFRELADYDEEKLLFTPEEFSEILNSYFEVEGRFQAGEFDVLPEFYQSRMNSCFEPIRTVGSGSDFTVRRLDSGNSAIPLTMIPFYSLEGGITAQVTTFAAINRNSKRPEDAFFVLDYLLSADAQRFAGIYDLILREALPMHMDLLSPDYSVNHWSMSRENFETFAQLRDQITAAIIPDAIYWEILMAEWDARSILNGTDISQCSDEVLAQLLKSAQTHCTIMEMELAES